MFSRYARGYGGVQGEQVEYGGQINGLSNWVYGSGIYRDGKIEEEVDWRDKTKNLVKFK